MKNSFFVALMTMFQFSYADVLESCRLGKISIQVEDGRNGGIGVGIILENDLAISVSDDIQIKQYSAKEIDQIVSREELSSVVESARASMEGVSKMQILKVAQDATVIRFIDRNGIVLVKIGGFQKIEGVCEPELQSNSQTPFKNSH